MKLYLVLTFVFGITSAWQSLQDEYAELGKLKVAHFIAIPIFHLLFWPVVYAGYLIRFINILVKR